MINELAHMFRQKVPVFIVLDVLDENLPDLAKWTGGVISDEFGPVLTIPSVWGFEDQHAEVGDVVVKNGHEFIVYSHEDWYGAPDRRGAAADFERVHFDAPDAVQ